MIKDYRYLYNPKQAEFYIKNGIMPESIDINKKTNKVFFKFKDGKELQKIYHKWMVLNFGEK